MQIFEYKVIPAPTKGLKAKGVKAGSARFALAIEEQMNALAAEGWDYHRAETLPSDERQGLTGTQTVYRNLLVFRRPVAVEDPETDDSLVAEVETEISSALSGQDMREDADEQLQPLPPERSD